MKKNLMFTIFFFLMALSAVCVYGQTAKDANRRGMDALDKKDYNSAIKEFTEAIRLDPNNAILYLKRGEAYYWKEDYDSAITDYTHATQLDIEDALSSESGYSKFFLLSQDRAIAITALTHAIQLKPDFERAYFIRGLMYYWETNWNDAIEDFTKVIQLNPNSAKAYTFRGWAFYKRGRTPNNKDKDIDDALADANSAKKIDPYNKDAIDLYIKIISEQIDGGPNIKILLLSIAAAFLCLYFFVIRSKGINATKKLLLSIGILYFFWVVLVVSDAVFKMGNGRTVVEIWNVVWGACFFPLPLIAIFLCFYFFVIRPIARKIKKETNQIKEKIQYINIPEICPHCKNPNPDKKPICEWCGNKIC